jgi:hypothetical protein
MRPGLKTLLAAVLVAALVVPAATATPGNGNGGNGGGKPSSAGASSDHGGGKPSWAGQGQAKKAEKAAARAEKAAAKAAAKAARAQGKADRAEARSPAGAARTSGKPDLSNLDELTPEDLEGLNPAWTCKVERALSGDSFAEDYGTNENDANAFGMCVSDEAHERDGVSEDAVEAFCEPAAEGEGAPEGEGDEGTPEDAEAALCAEDTESETTETESESLADLLAGVNLDDSEDEGSDAVAGEEGEAGEDDEGSEEQDSILAMLRSLF